MGYTALPNMNIFDFFLHPKHIFNVNLGVVLFYGLVHYASQPFKCQLDLHCSFVLLIIFTNNWPSKVVLLVFHD